jgi:hypothetical protein
VARHFAPSSGRFAVELHRSAAGVAGGVVEGCFRLKATNLRPALGKRGFGLHRVAGGLGLRWGDELAAQVADGRRRRAPPADVAAAWLAARPHLKRLDLSGLGLEVDDAFLVALCATSAVAERRCLEVLDLTGCGEVTAAGLATLGNRCGALRFKPLPPPLRPLLSAPKVGAPSAQRALEVRLRHCWRAAAPAPHWTAREVVEFQLKALQEGRPAAAEGAAAGGGSFPAFLRRVRSGGHSGFSSGPTEGTAKAFEFASPENQAATGPAEKSVRACPSA